MKTFLLKYYLFLSLNSEPKAYIKDYSWKSPAIKWFNVPLVLVVIINEKQKIPSYCHKNAQWNIIDHTNLCNSYVYENACVFIYMNYVDKHKHMHRTESSEIKWE